MPPIDALLAQVGCGDPVACPPAPLRSVCSFEHATMTFLPGEAVVTFGKLSCGDLLVGETLEPCLLLSGWTEIDGVRGEAAMIASAPDCQPVPEPGITVMLIAAALLLAVLARKRF